MERMRSIVWGASVCLLTACGTVNYVDIETYNPAEVTFPKQVEKVLVVNNAVPQPADAGYTYRLMGRDQDTCRAEADSALFDACEALGKVIVDAPYFADVLLYEGATRNDTQCYADKRLSPEQVSSLCEENGADAILSFDRLLFEMDKEVAAFADGNLLGTIDIHVAGVVRAYLPGREKPLATVYVKDSLFWTESAGSREILDYLLPLPDEALRAAGQYVGAKAAPHFVPHWVEETRWYFTGMGAPWKEAVAYAAAERWEPAAERWRALYEQGGWKARARAASNLALCEEMKGNLEQAHEWAERSGKLFKENAGEKSPYARLLALYADALAKRILANKKLNVQFGEESQ